jgi:hypothetical protein
MSSASPSPPTPSQPVELNPNRKENVEKSTFVEQNHPKLKDLKPKTYTQENVEKSKNDTQKIYYRFP